MSTLKEKAADLLEKCDVVTLCSITPEGYPRPVPMSKIKAEGLSTIWLSTGNSSSKTKDFRKNPKAGISYYLGGDSVALTGNVEVITDPAIKQQFWQEWFIAHFPGGVADPEYILLKFNAEQATYWIEGKFIHQNV